MHRQIIIIVSFVLMAQSSVAQQTINWAGYNRLPFTEDTTIGFLTRFYYNQVYHIPSYDITKSKAILEVRVIPLARHGTTIFSIIRFYADSTLWDDYYETRDEMPASDRIWKIVRKSIPPDEAKNMIAELIKRKLFTLDANEELAIAEKRVNSNPEYLKITENKKIERGSLVNFMGGLFIEIKYKNKYRSFRTGSVLFFNQKPWAEIERFQIGAELANYLKSLMGVVL